MKRRLLLASLVVLVGSLWHPPAGAAAQTGAAAAGSQAAAGLARVTCPDGEGQPIAGPQGLTFCSGTTRLELRSLPGAHNGVRVLSVEPGSPAEAAGVLPDDVVYRIGGRPVEGGADAAKRLQSLRTGEEAVVNFWRDRRPFLIRMRG